MLPKPSRVDEGGTEKGEAAHENELDLHIEEVLSRQQKVRRTLRGVWSFIKTRKFSILREFHLNWYD